MVHNAWTDLFLAKRKRFLFLSENKKLLNHFSGVDSFRPTRVKDKVIGLIFYCLRVKINSEWK